MGIDQVDKPQLLGQGIQQGRRAKLSGLHGAEYGHHLWWGHGGELGTALLHHGVLRAQVDVLDDTRVAIDPSGADPIEVRLAFFPFRDQTWHDERGNAEEKVNIAQQKLIVKNWIRVPALKPEPCAVKLPALNPLHETPASAGSTIHPGVGQSNSRHPCVRSFPTIRGRFTLQVTWAPRAGRINAA